MGLLFTEQVLVRRRAGLLRRARRAESRVRCGAVPAARAPARSARALCQTLLPRRDVSTHHRLIHYFTLHSTGRLNLVIANIRQESKHRVLVRP